jgi:hypothetical protein
MKNLVRRGLLFIVFLLVLQLLVGVTTALADPGYHVVRAGETLFSIGRLYGVNPYTIASANGLPNPDYIQIGQLLYIPGSSGWNPAPPTQWGYQPYYWWYGYYWPYYQQYWWWNWCWWDP